MGSSGIFWGRAGTVGGGTRGRGLSYPLERQPPTQLGHSGLCFEKTAADVMILGGGPSGAKCVCGNKRLGPWSWPVRGLSASFISFLLLSLKGAAQSKLLPSGKCLDLRDAGMGFFKASGKNFLVCQV